jgi:hypothetical protein
MSTPADLLAARLGTLTYTDDSGATVAVPLIQFRNPAPEQAETIAGLATMTGQAIIEVLETEYAHITHAELAALRSAAALVEHLRNGKITPQCHCGTRLFAGRANGHDYTSPIIDGPAVITAMARMSPECALAHQAVT